MNGLILFVAIIFFLWVGRSILIPLLVAIFLWYLINATATYVRKIFPFNSDNERRNRPIAARAFDWTSNILSVLVMCGLLYFFATQIQPMFREMAMALPELQHKFVQFGDYLSQSLGLRFDASMIPNVANIAASIGASVAGIVTSTGMILVYMIFLFVEQSTFNKKFSALITNKREYKKARFIVDSIDDNMKKYLFMKTLLSGITGVLSYFWLQMIGVEFAGIWAFIVFVTSYIPTIGAIVACALPRNRCVCIANIVFIGDRPIITATIINGRWIDCTANYIRQYIGTKINGQNFEPVDTGDINKPGILGNDLGHCRHVFQRTVIGGNIHHHRPI